MAKRVAAMANDLMGLSGAAFIVHGIDMVYRPAAFIVAGAILTAAAFVVARRT